MPIDPTSVNPSLATLGAPSAAGPVASTPATKPFDGDTEKYQELMSHGMNDQQARFLAGMNYTWADIEKAGGPGTLDVLKDPAYIANRDEAIQKSLAAAKKQYETIKPTNPYGLTPKGLEWLQAQQNKPPFDPAAWTAKQQSNLDAVATGLATAGLPAKTIIGNIEESPFYDVGGAIGPSIKVMDQNDDRKYISMGTNAKGQVDTVGAAGPDGWWSSWGRGVAIQAAAFIATCVTAGLLAPTTTLGSAATTAATAADVGTSAAAEFGIVAGQEALWAGTGTASALAGAGSTIAGGLGSLGSGINATTSAASEFGVAPGLEAAFQGVGQAGLGSGIPTGLASLGSGIDATTSAASEYGIVPGQEAAWQGVGQAGLGSGISGVSTITTPNTTTQPPNTPPDPSWLTLENAGKAATAAGLGTKAYDYVAGDSTGGGGGIDATTSAASEYGIVPGQEAAWTGTGAAGNLPNDIPQSVLDSIGTGLKYVGGKLLDAAGNIISNPQILSALGQAYTTYKGAQQYKDAPSFQNFTPQSAAPYQNYNYQNAPAYQQAQPYQAYDYQQGEAFKPYDYQQAPAYKDYNYQQAPAYQSYNYQDAPAYQSQSWQNAPEYQQAKYTDQQDWMKTGTPTDIYNDPYTQAMLKQTRQGVESSAAAKGTLLSGKTMQSIADTTYARNLLPMLEQANQQNTAMNQYNQTGTQNKNAFNLNQSQSLNAYNQAQNLAQNQALFNQSANQNTYNLQGNTAKNATLADLSKAQNQYNLSNNQALNQTMAANNIAANQYGLQNNQNMNNIGSTQALAQNTYNQNANQALNSIMSTQNQAQNQYGLQNNQAMNTYNLNANNTLNNTMSANNQAANQYALQNQQGLNQIGAATNADQNQFNYNTWMTGATGNAGMWNNFGTLLGNYQTGQANAQNNALTNSIMQALLAKLV